MHIDSYQFGQITVDGISYSSDVIILGDTVQSNWWREQGFQSKKSWIPAPRFRGDRFTPAKAGAGMTNAISATGTNTKYD